MNKIHDYRLMEREYVTTDISLRELSRKHGVSSHSLVVNQAKKLKWAEKREQYQRKESEAFIEKHADRQAERQAQIHDRFLDAVDAAITKFREDMWATEKKRIDGEWVEVPVMRFKPKDVAILLERISRRHRLAPFLERRFIAAIFVPGAKIRLDLHCLGR